MNRKAEAENTQTAVPHIVEHGINISISEIGIDLKDRAQARARKKVSGLGV
ncbi:hypothetical protein JXA32_07935 [Candidatus Sumerlaeota bacterium]|nr:hypothetical protein [Candidatus Sumerlaeota bacterium]